MTREGVVFSDVDGTLCFHGQAHGIREVDRNEDGTLLVEDPSIGRRYRAFDVSSRTYKVYLDVDTQRLAHKVRERFYFVYVTGGRQSTVQSRMEHLNFADALIIESGAVILDAGLNPDRDWLTRLQPERDTLAATAERLRRLGWRLDDEGRTSALRVRKMDNPQKPPGAFERLCGELELPGALKKTINMEHLDIILNSAGKGNAVRYWMERNGRPAAQSAGIGDDINDIDFLRVTGRQYVLASAFPEVRQVAEKEGWYISRGVHFEGINEVLRHILEA